MPCAFGLVQLDHFGPIEDTALAKSSTNRSTRSANTPHSSRTPAMPPPTRKAVWPSPRPATTSSNASSTPAANSSPRSPRTCPPEEHAELTALLRKMARLTTDTTRDHLVGEAPRHGA
ncbi:hypothetical protein ACU686_32055 [Yinghuangia aomiensis]